MAKLDSGEGANPAAPYHDIKTEEGGLTQGGGSTPQEGTPPRPGPSEIRRTADEKIDQERSDHEHEGSTSRR